MDKKDEIKKAISVNGENFMQQKSHTLSPSSRK